MDVQARSSSSWLPHEVLLCCLEDGKGSMPANTYKHAIILTFPTKSQYHHSITRTRQMYYRVNTAALYASKNMPYQQQSSTRRSLEQVSGDSSLPSYSETMKDRSPIEVTEKEIELERSTRKQSRMSAFKSMLKDKTTSSSKDKRGTFE